jgi:hypothetical protein
MVLIHVGFFTPALVYFVMLTEVLATRGVTTGMECFPLARFLDEDAILPVGSTGESFWAASAESCNCARPR